MLVATPEDDWARSAHTMLIFEIILGILAAYAVDAWKLKRWLKRDRPEDWRNWKTATGWRQVALSWIIALAVTALAAFAVGR
jgi:hypothetical protein